MAKTILVAGYGPGISSAVAEKFGAQGFQVALVGRTTDKLNACVAALQAKGVKAAGFTADLSDPVAAKEVIAKVHTALGRIGVLEWTAAAAGDLGADLLTASPEVVRSLFDVPISGLVAAVQAAHADLKSEKGALFVTNGGAGFVDPAIDKMMVEYGRMGLAVGNAAKHKLVGLLAARLAPDGIYVAEIMIAGVIRGTPFDRGQATIEGKTVAEKYWELYTARRELRTTVK